MAERLYQLQLPRTSKQLSIIVIIALLMHLLFMYMLLHDRLSSIRQELPQQPADDDLYIAQQLLSAGQHQATVTFQHEPPSDEITEQANVPTPTATEQNKTRITPQEQPPTPHASAPRQQRSARVTVARQRTNNQDRTKLAALTQGFLKSMQQEAGFNHPAVQDIRQLSLQMYTSKIWHIIKQSFLAEDNSIHLSGPVEAQTQLIVTIERDGKLRDIRLLYPQHMHELRLIERLIVQRAQNAGLFPPLPNSIAAASKSFCFPLHIRGQAGLHTYSMSYQ